MKHTIRILTLLAAMILTAGHVWGTPAINVKVTGGSIEFYSTYSNGALSDKIITGAEAGATVYIKATPDALFTPMGMTFNAYASTGSSVAQARTRNGSNTAPGIGQTIEVSPVTGQPGIFTFTMPANGTNVNIDATFADKTLETVSYIDTDGQTKQAEAYVLDGTEVTLGEIGTTESYTEFWYVCKTDLSYTSLNFPSSCNVNIILADGVEMKVENSTATAINCHGSLGLYGQSTGDTKGVLTAISTYTSGYAIHSEHNITISGAEVTATANAKGSSGRAISSFYGGVSITGSKVTANGTSFGINANKGVTISGSEVTATGNQAISSVDGGVSITDARTVTANGTSYGISAPNDVTISGSEVTAKATATYGEAISSVNGGVSITGGTVTANGTSFGINANKGVTISGSEVTATGNQAISSVDGGVSITDARTVTANGTSYGINANKGVTISGSEVTATGDWAIYSVGGSVSITDASTVIAKGTSYGVGASGYGGDVTISNSEVEATATGTSGYAIFCSGDVSITGGIVTVNGTSNGIDAFGDVTISSSQVIATSGENGSGITGSSDIILSWTNTTDFIMASSYKAGYGKAVTTADGKRFMAYTVDNTNPQSPVETPAAIISGTVSDLTAIAGKMLRPLEDYYVSIPSGLSIVDKTPTFTSGSTSYYKTAENAEVTINVGSYGQKGIELIGTNVPANITFNDDFTQATFTMTAAYVAITDIRYYTTEVAYVDADGNQATTPAADGETPATKVYILAGTETTIGEEGKVTWYISNTTGDGIGYNDWIKTKGTVHLILADGSKMTVDGNLTFEGEPISNSALSASGPLTIYGQSNGTGTLNAITGSGAAIHVPDHALTICGGVVNVEANTAFNGKSLIIYGSEFTTKAEEGTTNNTSISATNVQINDGKVNIGGAIQSAGNAAQDIQIYGGQVSVSGSISSGADIILGWTSATDFIKASSYNVDTSKDHYVKIADGKVLKYTDTDDESTVKLLHTGIVLASVINGKELTPYGIFGYCGQDKEETTDVDESKNVTWSIPVDDPATEDIDESKTITISGTGYMMYYNSIQNADESWSNGAPWKAFADEIEAVVIKDGITYVGSNTFAHCPNIKSVTLPAEGIYEIGPGAFADCTSLTSIDIPMSVNNIGDGAFAGCSNLATVSIGYGEVTSFTIGTDVFPATTTILVPEAVLSDYQAATGWSTYQIAPAKRTLFAAESTKLWMTWCDKYAYVKPEGVTVYTVSSVATDKVTLAEVSGGVIPAYTPVLLYRAAAGEDAVTATFSAVGTAPASGYDAANGICSQSNQAGTFTFFGATTAMAKIPDNDFTYYNGGLTYVLYGDKFLKSDSNNGIAANRCWLKLDAEGGTGPVNARQLVIVVDDETTAVESEKVTVNSEKFAAATVWYTLDGRKLSGKPTKKGLYIYNGKKTVVK